MSKGKEKTTKEKVFKPQDLEQLAYGRGYSRFRTEKHVKSAKRANLIKKTVIVLLTGVMSIMLISYAAVYMLSQTGVFSIKMLEEQGTFSMSTSEDFEETYKELKVPIIDDMTCYAYSWINDNFDNISSKEGAASTEGYLAYNFYIKNESNVKVNYHYSITVKNTSGEIEDAIRILIQRNDERKVYAKWQKNGEMQYIATSDDYASYPAEAYENNGMDTIPFGTYYLVNEDREGLEAGGIDKFTVVVWLEGSDPECTDNILGDLIKMEMSIS